MNWEKTLLLHWIIYSLDPSIGAKNLKCSAENRDFEKSKHYISLKNDADLLQTRISDNNVQILIEGMSYFPYKLSLVASSPYILYAIWNIKLLQDPILSVVWPRLKTKYADMVLEKLFSELRGCNVVTASGLAEWVDRLTHRLSILSNIPTIAILWCWLRHYMNSAERNMLDAIVDNGWLVLSEFPLDMKATGWSYPQRNRIVAGIANCVFLPEAAEKSGSLITVDFANKMQIPVFATANSIFLQSSKWVNRYIEDWKITLVSDLALFVKSNFWRLESSTMIENMDLSDLQINILQVLEEKWPVSIWKLKNVLWKEKNINSQDILSELSVLEVMGVVEECQMGVFGMR